MGNLHEGHLDLVRRAARAGRPIVTSIFVNPLQFGTGEDYERYPRTLKMDAEKLAYAGCDVLFAPDVQEMYPEPQGFHVQPPNADILCGAFRPGHFSGVCTVVLKLFDMVQPHSAIFGKKDYQQLHLIRAMVRQFNLPIEIVAAETVRAADGLALSSRNGYLSAEERLQAPQLYAELKTIVAALENGETDYASLESKACSRLENSGWRVDYVSIRSQRTLQNPKPGEEQLVVLAAAWLNRTRLIDNLEY